MAREEAQISVNRANEIEEWLKSEYTDIHVDHLRDCGTKCFWFTDPTSEYRCVGLIQIPITTDTYYDAEANCQKVTLSFQKVIFNVTDEEYPMDVFYKIFQSNKQFIKDYIANCRAENKCGILKPQGKVYNYEDTIKDLRKELTDEIDREIFAKLLKNKV